VPDLLPDPTLADLDPADLPGLLARLPGADLYLQDEVEVALHPTLTRVWCRQGRRGQRLVEAPGTNKRRVGFGLVDWRDGWLDWELAEGRRAAPFCAQLRRALARTAAVAPSFILPLRTAAPAAPLRRARSVRQRSTTHAPAPGRQRLTTLPAAYPSGSAVTIWRPIGTV
jgi:hypothetical protein